MLKAAFDLALIVATLGAGVLIGRWLQAIEPPKFDRE